MANKFVKFNAFRVARLKKKLRALPHEAQNELRRVMPVVGAMVRDTAKGFVPVRSGDLQDSIHILKIDRFLAVAVQSDDPIAHLIEFGTAERVTKKGKPTGRGPPMPFLFPAYRINKRRIKGRMTRAIKKSIKKVARQ